MLFCNFVSLHSNSHGFPSRKVGWVRETLPPAANILLITSHLKIFSLYQSFILPSLIGNFHKSFILKPPNNYIFGCSHSSYSNFLSFNFILFLQTVGNANLDFNWWSIIHSVVFTCSLENGSNSQNHSSSGPYHPMKNFSLAKFPIPPVKEISHYHSLTLFENPLLTRTV